MNTPYGALLPLADGNPGAMTFLIQIISDDNLIHCLPIMSKIESTGIKGTDLYVMYSDLCNKDMLLVKKLCLACPNDILIDACSRQDYSGRELVKEYLK